jgi:hypothetical protein
LARKTLLDCELDVSLTLASVNVCLRQKPLQLFLMFFESAKPVNVAPVVAYSKRWRIIPYQSESPVINVTGMLDFQ